MTTHLTENYLADSEEYHHDENRGQDTIHTIQKIHDAIQDSNCDTLRALLDLEGLDRLPDNSVLKELYNYLFLHHAYIATVMKAIDSIDQSIIYEES